MDTYEIFCAVLYVLKSGCQWRMLPDGFPKWQTVYYHWRIWSKPSEDGPSLLEQALKNQVGEVRENLGRNASPSLSTVDAQSVKNTDSAECKGYDAGKKISGIKRHIAVDTQGILHTSSVTPANVTDRMGALEAMDRCLNNLSEVEKVMDGGYTFC